MGVLARTDDLGVMHFAVLETMDDGCFPTTVEADDDDAALIAPDEFRIHLREPICQDACHRATLSGLRLRQPEVGGRVACDDGVGGRLLNHTHAAKKLTFP